MDEKRDYFNIFTLIVIFLILIGSPTALIYENYTRNAELAKPQWQNWEAFYVKCLNYRETGYKNKQTGEFVISIPFTEDNKKTVDFGYIKPLCVFEKL